MRPADRAIRPPPTVSTKFQAPTYDDGLVDRSRLTDILRAGRNKRVVLIQAPAGFGKTTLAVQWQRILQAEGVPVAWLSLDRDDNDAVWFLGHLIEAVRRVEPALASELGDMLEERSDDARRYVLSELVNQIADYKRDLAVVLEDWHLIDDPHALAALEFLLDVGPQNLHLVVTSRTRSLPLGRLKVRNQITEVNAELLRFDQEESASFLLELNALELDRSDVERLWSTTDGWVAALQLASLSLRSCHNPAALIWGFSGEHHSIADYFAENVLNALPSDVLDFLLATSICDRLCGDLAAAVSGQQRGQAMLEDLERQDMFLRPLDDNREWFRYHHLFADYLRRRLERDQADRIETLHRTASAWFADQGFISEAVTHALAAGNDTGAVDMVERHAMYLVELSRMATLLGLVNKLPPALLPSRPTLQIAIAWANCLLQRSLPAQTALDHMRAELGTAADDASRDILGEADVVQACIDIYGDRVDRAAVLVRPYLAEHSANRAWVVAVAANIHTFVDIHCFQFDMALARQRWANTFHARTSGPFAGVYGRCFAGLAAFAQLDLVQAGQSYQEAVGLARSVAGRQSHAARLAGALLGQWHYERGELDAAERLLEECHELGGESGVADFMISAYCTLARIKALRGDIGGAAALLAEGHITGAQLRLPRLTAAVTHERVRLHLACGEMDKAANLAAAQHGGRIDGNDGIRVAVWQLRETTRALVLADAGNCAAAIAILSSMLAESTRTARPYAQHLARVDLAAAQRMAGRPTEAARVLAPTLVVGAREGMVRSIVDGGPAVMRVITDLQHAGRARRWPVDLPEVPLDYLLKLLAVGHADANAPASPGALWPAAGQADPKGQLSAREIQILRLLDQGLSNKEIGRQLGLAINTVKWYLKGINIKLGVTRRQQSVSEAHRRHLLA